jgi:hypothetical protein
VTRDARNRSGAGSEFGRGVIRVADRERGQLLERSAEASSRRKGTPYRSAMSLLAFYVNRAGRTLPAERVRMLERAKQELRVLFGRARRASPS